MGIALAFHVTVCEMPVQPGVIRTLERALRVVCSIVPKDFSSQGIGGSDLPPAVEDALGLIKIHGFSDIVGNNGVVLPELRDAIDLNS